MTPSAYLSSQAGKGKQHWKSNSNFRATHVTLAFLGTVIIYHCDPPVRFSRCRPIRDDTLNIIYDLCKLGKGARVRKELGEWLLISGYELKPDLQKQVASGQLQASNLTRNLISNRMHWGCMPDAHTRVQG